MPLKKKPTVMAPLCIHLPVDVHTQLLALCVHHQTTPARLLLLSPVTSYDRDKYKWKPTPPDKSPIEFVVDFTLEGNNIIHERAYLTGMTIDDFCCLIITRLHTLATQADIERRADIKMLTILQRIAQSLFLSHEVLHMVNTRVDSVIVNLNTKMYNQDAK